MMKIKITETFEYSPDGTEASKRVYLAGAEPTLDDAEAEMFIAKGLAEPVPALQPIRGRAPARAVIDEKEI